MRETQPILPGDKKKKRFWELDFIRGLAVILMVFDHFMYSIGFFFRDIAADMGKTIWSNFGGWIISDTGYWNWPLRTYVRLLTLVGFFFICGVSCSLSKSNFKRGALCFLVGCGITFVTITADAIMDIGCSIYFGVLHMIGVSILLYGLIDLISENASKLVIYIIDRVRRYKAEKGVSTVRDGTQSEVAASAAASEVAPNENSSEISSGEANASGEPSAKGEAIIASANDGTQGGETVSSEIVPTEVVAPSEVVPTEADRNKPNYTPVSQKTRETVHFAIGFVAPTIGLILLILFFALWGGFDEYGEIMGKIAFDDPSMSILASIFIPVKYGYVDGVRYALGGADAWTLLPWASLILMGGFVGRGIYKTKYCNYLSRFDGKWNRPVCFVGRHAILVYVLHQVVIFILLFIITLIA